MLRKIALRQREKHFIIASIDSPALYVQCTCFSSCHVQPKTTELLHDNKLKQNIDIFPLSFYGDVRRTLSSNPMTLRHFRKGDRSQCRKLASSSVQRISLLCCFDRSHQLQPSNCARMYFVDRRRQT